MRYDEATPHQQQALKLVEELTHFANGMSREQQQAFAEALASDHPTLIGQVAKVVALGVMMRATRNPEYRPYDTIEDACTVSLDNASHPSHDGRLDCNTIIGAGLMARQSFI